MIADYERLLAGTSPVPVMPANAQPAAALIDAETLFKRAHAIIAKSKQNAMPSPSRPAAAPVSQSLDPRDMTASQLEKAIETEKSHDRRAELFHELRAREKGEPSRRSIELTRHVSNQQLEQMIEAENDPDRRQELFRCLCRREEWRRKR